MILEYKKNRTSPEGALITPLFIENGGHLHNPDDATLIGFCQDSANREYKIPDDVRVILGAAALKARSKAINVTYPYKNDDDTTMTDVERDQFVDDIITAYDLGGAGKPKVLRFGQATIDDTDSPYALSYDIRTLLIDASAGSITVNIPTAVGCRGLRFTFVLSTASGAFTVTLDPAGSETINGATTDTGLDAQYDTMTIESDGANWLKV